MSPHKISVLLIAISMMSPLPTSDQNQIDNLFEVCFSRTVLHLYIFTKKLPPKVY